MKKSLARGLVVFLALGTLISPAWAKEAGDAATRKQMQSFLDTVGDMFDRKDLEAVAQTVIPGATFRYANGRESTIEEWKARAVKEFAGIATMKSKFTVERVLSAGDTRIITYKETHNYVLAGEKGHKYRSVSRWSVTLAKTPQGWKAVHFVEFFEKITRDGKPLKPKAVPNAL